MDNMELDTSKVATQPVIQVNKTDPELKKVKKSTHPDMKELIKMVHSRIESIKNNRQTWLDRKVRYFKQRYGIRPTKNNPWPGCSNAHIFTIDKAIRKLKPSYVALSWTPELICEFKRPQNIPSGPYLQQSADYNSRVLDHVIREKMDNSLDKIALMVDRMLQDGFEVVKVSYDYKTITNEYTIDFNEMPDEKKVTIINNPQLVLSGNEEMVMKILISELIQQGVDVNFQDEFNVNAFKKAVEDFKNSKLVIKIKVRLVVQNAPKWTVCKNENIYVDNYVTDFSNAEFICHELFLTPNDVRMLAARGKIKPECAEFVLEKHSKRLNKGTITGDDTFDDTITKLTGGRGDEDLIAIREVCCMPTLDKSKPAEKFVLTYFPCYQEEEASFIKWGREDWPYVRLCIDKSDLGWLAPRGIPAMLDYYATQLNSENNQFVDLVTLSSAPMLEYVAGKVNMANVRYIPGQGIPVKEAGSINPVIVPPGNTNGLLEHIRLLKYEIEDYISAPDFTLSDPESGANAARSATEILTKARDREGIFSLDATLFLKGWQKLLKMTWEFWLDYGPEEYEVQLEGSPNPIRWSRQQGLTPLIITPVGTAQEVNPVLKARQNEMLLMLMQNPVTGPMMRIRSAVSDIVKSMSPTKFQDYILSEQEWEQQKQMMQQMAQQQQQQALGFEMQMVDKKIATQEKQTAAKLQQDMMKTGLQAQVDDQMQNKDIAGKIAIAQIQKENKNEAKT